MDTIIPESTEQEVSVEQENATFFVLGDAAYTSEIIEEYNRNAVNKTNKFNANSDTKVKEYNTNATNKTTAFDNNYDTKVAAFNKNAETQTKTFNSNAITKENSFNANATTSIQNYNANAEQKLYEFNANALSYEEGITDNSNRIKRLETDIFDSGEANGSSINIKDSTLAEFQEISVDGVCKQETRSGKNLFDLINSTISNVYGTPPTKQDNGILGGWEYRIDLKKPLKAGSYTLSFKVENADNNSTANLQLYDSDGNILGGKNVHTSGVVTFESTTNVAYFKIDNGTKSTTTLIYDIQIEEGPTATEFEKYGASPSPDFPSEIKTIENSLKITSCNKNLFDKDNENMFLKNLTLDNDGKCIGAITDLTQQNYIRTIILKCKPNTTYSIQKLSSKTFYVYDSDVVPTLDYQTRLIYGYVNANNRSFTTSNNANYILFKFFNTWASETYTYDEIVASIQIEENTQATPFEQHLETQIEANLPEGEFIGKIDDTYKDTLKVEYNEEDGQYHKIIVKNVGRRKYTSEDVRKMVFLTYDNIDYARFAKPTDILNYGKNIQTKLMCDKAIWSEAYIEFYNSKNIGKIIETAEGKFFWIGFPKETTEEEMKEALSEVEVVYPLAEPYEIDLGVVDMPLSYSPETNVFTTHDLQPVINVMYYRDIKNTITTMQTDIETLKEAVATLTANQTNLASEVDLLQEQTETESEVIE